MTATLRVFMCKPISVCYTVQRAKVSVTYFSLLHSTAGTDFSLLHSTAGKGLCHRFQSATQYSGQRSLSPISVCYTVQLALISVSYTVQRALISVCYTVQRAKVFVTIRPMAESRGARCLEAAELSSSGWPCAHTAAPSTKTQHLPDRGGRKHIWRHALGSLIPDTTPTKGPWEELGHVIRSCPSSRTSRIWSCVLARSGQLPLIQDFKDMELRLGQEWAAAPHPGLQGYGVESWPGVGSCPSSRTSRIWSCVLARSGQLPLVCSSRGAPDSPPPPPPPPYGGGGLPRMMNSNGFHLLAVLEQ